MSLTVAHIGAFGGVLASVDVRRAFGQVIQDYR